MLFITNILLAAAVIATASWLSGRYPGFAGFMVAMPLASLIVLPMSYLQHGSETGSVEMARSIFIAVPVSLLFFVPFFLSDRLELSFWQAYGIGVLTLPVAYLLHRLISQAVSSA